MFKSEETKSKIGEGVKEGWKHRRVTIMFQKGCHAEWCNVIAEAARVGFYGEEQLQWNSYEFERGTRMRVDSSYGVLIVMYPLEAGHG
jgi:hypothetical protein